MKTLICFLIASQPLFLSAQFPVSPNQFDEKGNRTGHWTILYDSTFKKEVRDPDSAHYYRLGRFEAGKPVGKVRDFFRSGQKQWEGYMVSINPDVMDGVSTFYHENGKVHYVTDYVNGKRNGRFREYSTTGKILSEGSYINSNATGKWNYYAEAGYRSDEYEYKNDELNGSYFEFFETGAVRKKGQNVNGKRQGLWIVYHANGNLNTRCEYQNGLKHGKWEWFNEKGLCEQTGLYTKDFQTGLWIDFYEDGKTLLKRGSYDQNGKRIGLWMYYHPNGATESSGNMVNGNSEGVWEYFYESGRVSKRGSFQNGNSEGLWEYFYENGKLSNRGSFQNGKAEGEWLIYNENGIISDLSFYHLGEWNGNSINYYSTGKIKNEGAYRNGKKQGKWKSYYENGKIESEGSFEEEKRIGEWKFYFEDGRPDAIENYKDGEFHGDQIYYYANGNLRGKVIYVLGKRDGTYQDFFEDGNPKSSSTYRNGLYDGEKLEYYPNGKFKAKTNYVSGVEHGLVETYYENGNLLLSTTSKNGQMEGLLIIYHKNGNKAVEKELQNGSLNGIIIIYDSVTGKLSERGFFLKNKKDGKWVRYNAKGKIQSTEYYIKGFKETQRNVQDSIQTLIDQEDFESALNHMPWLEKVTKRDITDKEARALPNHMYSKIYAESQNYPQNLKYSTLYLNAIKKVAPGSKSHKTAVNNVAVALHGLKEYDEALKMYDQAIDMEKKNGLVPSYWRSVINKVSCLYDANRSKEGEEILENELGRAKEKYADSARSWYMRHEAADYYFYRPDDYKRAAQLFKELLNDIHYYRQSDNEYRYSAYRHLAFIFYNEDNYSSAISYYDSAIAFAEQYELTLNPAYNESLVKLFNCYTSLTDSVSGVKRKSIIDKIKKQVGFVHGYDLLSKMYRSLQLYEYDYGSNNDAVLFGEKAEENALKAGKEKTLFYALVLQTQAWSIYNSDKRNDSLSEEKFLKAVSIRKELYGEGSVNHYGSRIRLGSFYNNISQYQKAIVIFEESIPHINADKDYETLAEVNKYMGEAFYYFGKYTQSISSNKAAYEFYSQQPDQNHTNLKRILGIMAKAYSVLKKYEEAKDCAERAYQMAVKYSGEKSESAQYRLSELGSVHQNFNAYAEAQKCYQQAANMYKELNGAESENYISTLTSLAAVYRNKREAQKGIELLMPHVKSLEAKPVSHLYYSVLDELANDCSSLKKYESEELYRKKLETVARQLYGQSWAYANQLKLIGDLYKTMNKVDEAEQYLTLALKEIQQTEYRDAPLSSQFYYTLGLLKESLEKNKEAEELFLQAMAISEKDTIDAPIYYETAGEYLASFYTKMGRYKDAEILLKRIASFIERVDGRTFYYARIRAELVSIYSNLKEYQKAREVALPLVTFVEEEFGTGNWLALHLHTDLGGIAEREEDFKTAQREYQHCIDAYNRIQKPSEINLADLASSYSNLANAILSTGQVDEAEKNIISCERIRKNSSYPVSHTSKLIVRKIWAKIHEARGNYSEAEADWNQVLNILLKYIDENFSYMSDEEKAQFWKSQGRHFNNFQSFASRRATQNQAITGTMYNVQLATKAILLSSSNKIRKRILTSGDTSMVNKYYHWLYQREQRAQLYSTPNSSLQYLASVDSVKKRINVLEKELNIAVDEQLDTKGASLVNWKQIQALLKPHEAAIEIIRFNHYDMYQRDSVIYIALVLTAETKSAPRLIVLPNGKMLEGRAFRFYKNAMASLMDDRTSYTSYWSLIEPAVKDKSHIYLSLDGVYNSINLNSLRAPSGDYLVDTKNITLLSNTKDLLQIKGKRLRGHDRTHAILMGFPTYFLGKESIEKRLRPQRDFDWSSLSGENRSGIDELPGTKVEIEKVKELLTSHQWKVSAFLDETATENAIKDIIQPKLLHVATHGYFTTDNTGVTIADADPMLRSGLLFTGAANFLQDKVNISGDNGILTAYEASNLNLSNTELVVLSACETGKGEVQNGEGVYGLQRAFQTAGAQAIIMSLWKVDDEATQELMTSFYSNWMRGQEKSQAFKQAQLQIKEKYNHPYYWGAFVMMGN